MFIFVNHAAAADNYHTQQEGFSKKRRKKTQPELWMYCYPNNKQRYSATVLLAASKIFEKEWESRQLPAQMHKSLRQGDIVLCHRLCRSIDLAIRTKIVETIESARGFRGRL